MPTGPALFFLYGEDIPADAVHALAARFAEDGYDTRAVTICAPTDGGRFALLAFGAAARAAIRAARSPQCAALALFDPAVEPDGAAFNATLAALTPPVLVHRAGPGPQPVARESEPVMYRYPKSGAGFMLPGTPSYDPFPAGIAYSRTLEVLKRTLGPRPDLAGLFREHLRLEFEARDADATMDTMVAEPYVNHIPTMTGGTGFTELKRFYKHHFIPTIPADRQTIFLNEIVGADTVVIEAINCFTHDAPYDHYLPGVPPTGKRVEVPFVAIAKFRGDKLYYEHIYWDQASVLVQLGLLDPAGLPVSGREQADKVRDPTRPSNALMKCWEESEGRG